MNFSINLNDQFEGRAIEVNDVMIKAMLSPEFPSIQLFIRQFFPKELFKLSWLITKFSSSFFEVLQVIDSHFVCVRIEDNYYTILIQIG